MKFIEISAIPPRLLEESTQHKLYFESIDLGKTNAIGKNLSRQLVPTAIKVGFNRLTEQTRYFDGTKIGWAATVGGNTIKSDLLADMTALGMDSNILNAWEVPDEYCSATANPLYGAQYDPYETDAIKYGGFVSVNGVQTGGQFSYVNTGVTNAKARYGQSVKINVYNPASGARMEKSVYDLVADGTLPTLTTYVFPYVIYSDPRPQGCPIFAWYYNDGGTEQASHLTEYICGATWKQNTIISQTASGAYLSQLQMSQQKQAAVANTLLTIGGAAAGMALGGVGGAMMAASMVTATRQEYSRDKGFHNVQYQKVGNRNLYGAGQALQGFGGAGAAGIVGGLAGYYMADFRQTQQQYLLNVEGISASRPIQLSSSSYAREAGMNKFLHCITRYDDEDMIDFDSFLTKYGYNVGNMNIGTQHFWCRSDFVYIRINEITISSKNASQELLDKVTEQLKAGVRIWRTKVNINSMLPSGNRTPQTP